MAGWILPLILFVTPTVIILLIALIQFGWVWGLLWILTGSIISGLIFAIIGAVLYAFHIEAEDRRTGPPEAGAIGAGVGRMIMMLVSMAFWSWIGSGLGAFVAFRFLLP